MANAHRNCYLLFVLVPGANGPGRANSSYTYCWDGIWLVTLAANVYELCENSVCLLYVKCSRNLSGKLLY